MDKMPPGAAHATYAMAALTAAGGAFAYFKSKSQRSAAAGADLVMIVPF